MGDNTRCAVAPINRNDFRNDELFLCQLYDDNISGIFLANVNNKPIALMITQFEGQMQLECAAFVSLIILIVNIAMKFIVYLCKKKTI